MAISSKGETATFKLPSNIEDGARGFKHASNPHLGFATASLESGSANIDDSPLQEALLGMPMSGPPEAAFEASKNLRASHRLSVCVDGPIFQ